MQPRQPQRTGEKFKATTIHRALREGQEYVVIIEGAVDRAGNMMATPVTETFTVGTSGERLPANCGNPMRQIE